MGAVRNIAITVLSISFLTFVALFGRLPIFRRTPIGLLHRTIWIYIPSFFQSLDVRLTGGRFTQWLAQTGDYLMNEKHPLVLIFFLALLSVSEIFFVPPAWPRLSLLHKILVPTLITPPYVLLYAASTSDSSLITATNHERNMHLYPYDYAIFHPGHNCRTCKFLKPARSKHCSICKVCVARQDHHCIWLNNCVGRANYAHFLNLLLSVSVLVVYAVYLGYGILDQTIQDHVMRWSPSRITPKSHWSTGTDWSLYFHFWSLAIVDDVRVGGVTLLSLLSAPITFGLFLYHAYLIWAGMTTNESVKWADWRDDIADGVAFKGKKSELLAAGLMRDTLTPKVDWPIQSDQVLVRTEDGHPPGTKYRSNLNINDPDGGRGDEVVWKKVKKLPEVVNLYDLGFWDNIIQSFRVGPERYDEGLEDIEKFLFGIVDLGMLKPRSGQSRRSRSQKPALVGELGMGDKDPHHQIPVARPPEKSTNTDVNTLLIIINADAARKELEAGKMAEAQQDQEVADGQAAKRPLTPLELLLKIVLMTTESHFENRGMIDEVRMEHVLQAGKQVLRKSNQETDVRHNLGFSPPVWQGLTDVLSKSVPVLETQSFSWKNPTTTSVDGSSSNLIAYNYFSLVKDIERLNDLCTIARNLLATTKKAQNLAAEKGFDQQILKLIDVCVRVTARGFDGETNVRNEERWQKVVNSYKRLLITSLQFLHNFIMHNESRKLLLWLDLFGTSPYDETEPEELDEPEEKRVPLRPGVQDGVPGFYAPASAGELNKDWSPSIADLKIALGALRDPDKPPIGMNREEANLLAEKVQESIDKLENMTDGQRQQLEKRSQQLTSAAMAHSEAKLLESEGPPPLQSDKIEKKAIEIDSNSAEGTAMAGKWDWANFSSASKNTVITAEDTTVTRTPQSAATTLQEAKDQLMARLQDNSAILDEAEADQYDPVDGEDDLEDDHRSLDAVAGDQERGLLTDIPLVLGPAEIEALPMIIQAGIVDSFGLKGGERVGSKNMQSVRCHILLAQETGRNLLRELLIFIAAWDLPDDEFYFKMMVQIMEAILKNGLMPLAYQTFGQAKDIISPAQAVVIKILTQIFRAKYSPASSTQPSSQSTNPRTTVTASRVDVLVVRYIFTVFRQSIIPETCALIYLQGQIRQGHALAEDFPLNLWDMERVYEGVYQFLEFFAVLTESTEWKGLLVKWEIVSELVTLIRELDASIPKAPLSSLPTSHHATSSVTANANQAANQAQATTPVAVERPYDPLSPSSPTSPTAEDDHDPAAPIGNEDPADFEWRNLKKLVVLVLSSLVWKCPTVQNQIRQYGGVEMILACTNFDAHNPYIKEHAVMCLKFLLEGNKENQKVVEELEGRQVIKDGVLERRGLEATLDERGKVVVKPKERGTTLRLNESEGKVVEVEDEK